MGLVPRTTATVAVQTDYTDKDFDSLKLRLQNLIRSVFPEWTDYNVATFGNILLELYAFVGDVLGFYQDNQALNARITTATQRRALLGLVKLIGYVPATAQAATTDLQITLTSGSPLADARLPVAQFVRTLAIPEPARYQFLTEVVFLASTATLVQTVSVENSVTQGESFTSNGLGNQEFTLGQTPHIDGSEIIVAGNGTYSKVDDFLSSNAGDLHFTVVVDQFDRATVRFGNGVNGAVPVGGVTITYKTGGGVGGRVEAGKLTKLEGGSFTDDDGNSVTYTVTNLSASSGGDDRESVEQIRINAPASIRVINRTVALEDFEIHALQVPGVARALMLTSDQDAGVAENAGLLFIIPTGGGVPSTALKDAVLEQVTVTKPSTLTFSVTVQDPLFSTVDVRARVAFLNGFTPSAVKADIEAALAAFFAVENEDGTPNETIDFGGKIKDNSGTIVSELAWSDVHNAVRDTAGVRKVVPDQFLLNLQAADVTLITREFPQLGTVTIVDDDTGLTL